MSRGSTTNKDPVCYCILVHRESSLLPRLVYRLLEDARSTVVIHVDRKARGWMDSLAQSGFDPARVLVFSSQKVRWGHFSMCLAMANCMRRGLDAWPGLHRIVFLSGQHYLLAPAEEINAFYCAHRSEEFVERHNMLSHRWAARGPYRRRYRYYWPFPWIRSLTPAWAGLNRVLRIDRSLPQNLQPWSGSQWMAITGAAARYLLQEMDSPEISGFYSSTLIPDEMLFHTLLANSGFAPSMTGENLNYIDWTRKGRPKVLTMEHLNDLRSARTAGCFFTRKLDPERSRELLEALDDGL